MADWKLGKWHCWLEDHSKQKSDEFFFTRWNRRGEARQWNIKTLWEAAKGLPVMEVSVLSLPELDENKWFNHPPSVKRMVCHFKRVQKADLTYPIILDPEGNVMDGFHRIAKCLLEEKESILAVQFKEWPDPDKEWQGTKNSWGTYYD